MKHTTLVALKYCGIDVSKSSLVCAAIGDLDEHNRHFLPGQANDLGLVGAEPVVKRSFSNEPVVKRSFSNSNGHPPLSSPSCEALDCFHFTTSDLIQMEGRNLERDVHSIMMYSPLSDGIKRIPDI